MSSQEPNKNPVFGDATTAGELADATPDLPLRQPTTEEEVLKETVEALQQVSGREGADEAEFEGPDAVIFEGENFEMVQRAGEIVVKEVVDPTDDTE